MIESQNGALPFFDATIQREISLRMSNVALSATRTWQSDFT
jgi:hypothetical protein